MGRPPKSAHTSGMSEAGEAWFTLDQFHDRAQRVLDCRIAQREDLATLGTQIHVLLSVQQGRHQVTWEAAGEEEIESAAVRIRPLFLKDETVFHAKVMNALLHLTQQGPDSHRALLREGKKAWAGHKGGYRWKMTSAIVDGPPLMGRMLSDREIARDFMYGDLVHADPDARARLKHVPMEDRLWAAASWITDAIKLTETTRRIIIDLIDAGALASRPSS